jgi:SHAQKYF class myb-like DNA-binding protein
MNDDIPPNSLQGPDDESEEDSHLPKGTAAESGRWTKQEHALFLQGLESYGKEWKMVASTVKTRTVVQTRTHAQKYFQKLSKSKGGEKYQSDVYHTPFTSTAKPKHKAQPADAVDMLENMEDDLENSTDSQDDEGMPLSNNSNEISGSSGAMSWYQPPTNPLTLSLPRLSMSSYNTNKNAPSSLGMIPGSQERGEGQGNQYSVNNLPPPMPPSMNQVRDC